MPPPPTPTLPCTADFQLKLADFGLAAVNLEMDTLCHTCVGTKSYMAPEVMARQGYDGAKADLWSAGVVLFIMLAGCPPFQQVHLCPTPQPRPKPPRGADNPPPPLSLSLPPPSPFQAAPGDWWYNAVRSNRHDKFWMAHLRSAPDFPKLAQEFLNLIFVADSSQRASIDDLWNHQWMQGRVLQEAELTEVSHGHSPAAFSFRWFRTSVACPRRTLSHLSTPHVTRL